MDPYRRKVRYWDTDANGHVFNARYFIYWDDALTDFFEAAGLDFGTEGGPLWVTRRTECDFRGEANIGDRLATSVWVDRIGKTSVVFGLKTIEEGSGRLVTEGREIYVVIDPETRQPISVPAEARARLAHHVVGESSAP